MIEKYDKGKIGKQIARGTDRSVYMYGDNQVIKFSWLSILIGKKLHEKMLKDYKLSKYYFGDYIVETIDVSNPIHRRYIEIQPYIKNSTRLGLQHMTNPALKTQLEDISQRLEQMLKDGHYPLDLVGHAGMWNMCLSNILVDEYGKLRIIDTSLFETSSVGFLGWIIHFFMPIAKARQRYILKYLLHVIVRS